MNFTLKGFSRFYLAPGEPYIKINLLDLHIAGAITIEEFKERNDSLNDLLKEQESQLAAIHQEQAKAGTQELDVDAIRKELNAQLSFEGGINTALVATILDKIVVKKESTKEEIHLDIYLKLGQKYEAIYSPQNALTGINPPRSIDARGEIIWMQSGSLKFNYFGAKVAFCGMECYVFVRIKCRHFWVDFYKNACYNYTKSRFSKSRFGIKAV